MLMARSGCGRAHGEAARRAVARRRACRRTARRARASRPARARASPSPFAGRRAVVGDLQARARARRSGRRRGRCAAPRVLARVGQRLLHDPVRRQVHAGRQRRRSPSATSSTVSPPSRACSTQRAEVAPRPGCGASGAARCPAGAARRACCASPPAPSRPCARSSPAPRRARSGSRSSTRRAPWRAPPSPPRCARPRRELARDPRPLVPHGDALALALLALQHRHTAKAPRRDARGPPARAWRRSGRPRTGSSGRPPVAITLVHSPAMPAAAPSAARSSAYTPSE